jgi:hypothetical protein
MTKAAIQRKAFSVSKTEELAATETQKGRRHNIRKRTEIEMELEQAKAISELALRASGDLNSALIELLKGADSEESTRYKQIIGSILGEIYFNILRPVYQLYPDVAPDDLQTHR